MDWTVIMLLEGGGGADVTLYSAHVSGQTVAEAVWAAGTPLAEEDPVVVDLIVQEGHNVDVGGTSASRLRTLLNLA